MARARKIRRIHRSRDEIKRIVDDFEASDLSLSAFARSTRIPLTSLINWVRKSRNGSGDFVESPALIPVHVVENKSPSAEPVEVVLENRRIVRIYPGFDPDMLARVLPVVERSC